MVDAVVCPSCVETGARWKRIRRLALDRQPVPVPLEVIQVEVLRQDQLPDHLREARLILEAEERLLDVERDPALRLDGVERREERARRNVPEAERRHGRQAVERPGRQLLALCRGEAAEVGHAIGVVEARSVAFGRHARLGNDVGADEPRDAPVLQRLAHHAVAGPEVEHAQLGEVLVRLPDRRLQDLRHLGRRLALQAVVEQLLVEAGDLVDLGVVVKADGAFAIAVEQVEVGFVLADVIVDGRELDLVPDVHRHLSFEWPAAEPWSSRRSS
ncbi:MAG TPA: hypothetical protein VND92_06975 [Vicinamibacterales bacterium]|nr:hypothetical protein [Vicinamibacterales bacterium]